MSGADDQPALLAVLADRLRRAAPELPADGLPDTADGLRRVATELADGAGPLVAMVVHRLRLADWAAAACAFAAALDPPAAAAWRRGLTRTVFLAGAPERLRPRYAFDHVSPDGSYAWSGPAPRERSMGLRRLLKTFEAPLPPVMRPPAEVTVPRPAGPSPRPPRHHLVTLATAGLSTAEALVHLHHLLSEAVLDAIVAPGDRLRLRGVPRLTGPAEAFSALRVTDDPAGTNRLRAFAGLTEES